MLPILQIGPLAIQLPGLLLILGVWLGSLLSERSSRTLGLSPAAISNMIFYALIGVILGARLGYVIRFLDLYLESPLGILALNPNTLSPLEGVATGMIVAIVYGQRSGLPLWRTLDALAPGLAVFLIFLALAQLASGDAFGAESDLPWAIELWGARRHPTQVYSLVFASLTLLAVLRLLRAKPISGFTFLVFTGLAAIGGFIVEAFRGDSLIIFGTLRSAQVVNLVLVMVILLLLHWRARMIDPSN
jgi:phosphatidylglycerol:prolipoprotein diacylglycerol transferase